MSKYQVKMNYSDGATELDYEVYGNSEDAKERGLYLHRCYQLGGERLRHVFKERHHMGDAEANFEVVEV